MDKRLYEIDLYRFVAAVMVLVFHYTFVGYMLDYAPGIRFDAIGEFSRYFYLGINFFFIISGFVILMSAKDGQPGKFFISRFIRLYPAYWIGVLLTASCILYFNQSQFQASYAELAANATMFQAAMGIKHIESAYWTLWIEMQFYLVMFALAWCGWLRFILPLIGLSLLVCTVSLFTPWGPAFDLWSNAFPHWWGYFATGCLLYLIRKDGLDLVKFFLLLMALTFVICQNWLFTSMMEGWYGTAFNEFIILGLNLVFFALMLFSALAHQHPLRNVRFAAWGALTYPLYLIHQNIGYMLFNAYGQYVHKYVLLFATALLMLLIAYVIHRFVEQPLAPLLKKYLTLWVVRNKSEAKQSRSVLDSY
ncbi:acyltransferase family protein [Bowmanella pacifica]|uniref:Acyltransferase n=1 Tax=Bowmanella pacifica TaxID=502051 RepID=A0A917Z0W1_9ALTE|nr:acyltransferase [Bowmanella pacifica]GGO71932.1 acyltransferase [Bowmanella pacifica]